MPMGRPKSELKLNSDEEAQLESFARSRSLPAALTMRAKLILACAAGASNSEIAGRLQIGPATVGKWRRRFIERRISGLYDELRPGKPRSIDDENLVGTPTALACPFHSNLQLLVESSRALLLSDHRQSNSAWLLCQRKRVDCKN